LEAWTGTANNSIKNSVIINLPIIVFSYLS
jgi:hypothetical protein